MPRMSNRCASATAAREGSRCASYRTSEDLLHDLQGRGGDARRFLATGYAMAIHDCDAQTLNGSDLLAHLEGRNGADLRLIGIGYVNCVRDTLGRREVDSSPAHEPDGNPCDSDVDRVVRWLQDHPKHGAQDAVRAIRAALTGESAARRWALAGRLRVHSAMGWCAALGGALAIAALIAVHPWRTGWDAAFRQDFRLSQEASDIQTLILEERRYEKDTFLNIADREQINSYARKWHHSRLSLARTIARARELAVTEQDLEVIRQIDADFALYVNGFERVLLRIRAGQVTSAMEANAEFASYKDAVHRIEANSEALGDRALRRLYTTT